MKYRQQTPSGDYVFGKGNQEFYTDIEAVRQAVLTRLQLNQGDFWRDTTAGLPLYSKILLSSGAAPNIAFIDSLVQSCILSVPGVTEIVNYSSNFDGITREYSYTCQLQTQYSDTVLSGTF